MAGVERECLLRFAVEHRGDLQGMVPRPAGPVAEPEAYDSLVNNQTERTPDHHLF